MGYEETHEVQQKEMQVLHQGWNNSTKQDKLDSTG